jgi:hypothetical protein
MRAPRYRFPDTVRSATRTIATQMVRDGTIAQTPEELDAWISERPDVKEVLEKGGYGRAFDAKELFPLLQVFIVQAGGPAPVVDAPPPAPARPGLPVRAVIVVGIVLLLLAVAVALLR